jgi:hypothetical protein
MLSGADPKASAHIVYPNTLLTHGLAPTFPRCQAARAPSFAAAPIQCCGSQPSQLPQLQPPDNSSPLLSKAQNGHPRQARAHGIATTSYSLSDVPVAKRPSPRAGSSNRGRENGADDRLETNKTFITVADMGFRGQQRTRETAGC